MSPKFYALLWIVFAAAAAICWIAGALSMLALVVFGFTAFGLVFTGMMCVLPGEVAHSHQRPLKAVPVKQPRKAQAEKQPAGLTHLRPA